MPLVPVADAGDARIDDYRNVPDPELLRTRGLFVAEGRHVVRRLLTASRFQARSLLLTPAALDGLRDLLASHDGVPVYVVSQEVLNTITGFNIHRGCLALGERRPLPEWREVAAGASRLLVLERVANADNVGGIFRNAAAFGAAVLLGPACTDPLYRKAIRTSMGAALQVPFASLASWPDDLRALRADGFTLVALTPAADAQPLPTIARPRDRLAVLLGHEGTGLSPDALQAADLHVRIPMMPGVDSLNIATAAAIALYALSLES